MTLRSTIARRRDQALALVDRSDRASKVLIGAATFVAVRAGADRRILRAARHDDMPLNRSLQLVQWALAVAGHASFPRNFSPGDHLSDATSRRIAADLLRGTDDPSPLVERQLLGLDDDGGVEGALRAIEHDLRRELTLASRRPKRGSGVESSLQAELVGDVQTALAHLAVRPFLMSGTLLGIVRDGDFMTHDHDVDLGLLPGTDVVAVEATLGELETFDVGWEGPRLAARHRSGVTVDVFPHELRDGCFWHATRIHEWWNTPFELVPRSVTGREFWIPDDPERYLAENYGNWRTPVPFYDISFDTPNRRYRHGLDTVRFLHSRCVQALQRGDRWLLESAVRELRDEFGLDVTDLLADSPLLDRPG